MICKELNSRIQFLKMPENGNCLSHCRIFLPIVGPSLVLLWSGISWKSFLYSALLRLVEVGRQSQNSSFSCVTTNFLSAFCPTSSRRTTTHIPMVANIWNNWDWFNFLWFLFLESSWHLTPVHSRFCLCFIWLFSSQVCKGSFLPPWHSRMYESR